MDIDNMLPVHINLNLAADTVGTGKDDAPYATFHAAFERLMAISAITSSWVLAVRHKGSAVWEYSQ